MKKRMKKRITVLLALAIALTLSACASGGGAISGEDKTVPHDEKSVSQKQVLDEAGFEQLLLSQPLAVVETDYVVQSDQYKGLYPDMLCAIVQNNTSADIKDAVVAFVAWDENGLPIKIEGQFDFLGGEYIKKVNYTDINLIGGATFGEDNGYSLAEENKIASFKAVAISFETFDGQKWENPYYESFCNMYEGKKYSADMTVEVEIVKDTFAVETAKTEQPQKETMTAEQLEAELENQPLSVVSTQYVVQSETYKALYPDMLQAIIRNNTQEDIKDAVIAFAAWDKNGLPVKIEGQFDFMGGEYIKEVAYSDINLIGGATYGENGGFSLSEENKISTFKAIAVSYETFEGQTWKNPCYKAFCDLYQGKKIK